MTVLTTTDREALKLAIEQAPLLVGHNLITADLPVLERNGIIPSIEAVLSKVYDTQIAQHLLYPDAESGLDFWGSIVTDLPYWKDMPDKGEDVRTYCGRDVYGADQLFERGRAQLHELKMEHLLPYSQRAQCALYRMSERGVKVAKERIPEAKQQIETRIGELAAQMPFENWRSNPQVKDYFSARYTVRKGVDKHVLLGFIQKHGDPVARMLLEARELEKIRSTYLEPYEEFDDVIHSRFDCTKQGTGRISSADPNLFQLPKKPGKAVGDLGLRLVRSLIVPRHPDWVLVEADWAQVELRLVVLFAGAVGLQALLDAGVDIHGHFATRYGKSRDETKIAIHGGNYKVSPRELARQFDMPEEVVAPILTSFRKDNPEIPRWWDTVVQAVLQNQNILRLPSGRIRRFWGKVADWEKAAISTTAQGTVADMLLRVLWPLEMESRQHLQARILFPCHDAVLWECPPDEVEKVRELTSAHMEQSWDFLGGFRCPVEFKAGPSWAEVKKF